mmetsp:Transcript_45480/g.106861  ORF Transcript_45480/g.106861 Transcript_45480/m.106861 type:complete len:159 (-) Transcript_45480:138-614(-)
MGGVVSAQLGRPKKPKQFSVHPAITNSFGIKGFNGKIASMPGVGVIGLNSTTTSTHATSFSNRSDNAAARPSNRASRLHRPSQLAPSIPHISSTSSGLEVTSFQLSANKPPVCVVLSEEVSLKYPARSRIPFLASSGSSSRGVPWEERGGDQRGTTPR